ncbi:catechol 2,3-dioxygenase-like lactoylglutathione lyase family enzyme [Catenulispora sp. MAP5-51]|jgi:catechol 2,3-dioxygenase-like lactoylglutathione lyase family enzyme|uniref:VOC family protein n=1 Tax=Catenulispora sp. MAP5-51 TaxID=3156298 RepID=UPI003510FF9E
MKLASISGLTFQSSDLDRTVAFYEGLGLRVGKRDEQQATLYVNWFWITVSAVDGPVDPGTSAAVHIKVDDIQQAYEEVVAAGHKPAGEPAKRAGGGSEFELADPDGYRLVFFYKK